MCVQEHFRERLEDGGEFWRELFFDLCEEGLGGWFGWEVGCCFLECPVILLSVMCVGVGRKYECGGATERRGYDR